MILRAVPGRDKDEDNDGDWSWLKALLKTGRGSNAAAMVGDGGLGTVDGEGKTGGGSGGVRPTELTSTSCKAPPAPKPPLIYIRRPVKDHHPR